MDNSDWCENPYFEKHKPLSVTTRTSLPHWEQNEKLQFVTFRLKDSLPADVVSNINNELHALSNKEFNQLSRSEKIKYIKHKNKLLDLSLDKCHGECHLNDSSLRILLEKVIQEGNNREYDILSYIIMPNHVHLLLQMLEDHTLRESLKKIKGKSSFLINRVLGRKGALWQRESYDRIIRNDEHLNRCIEYIRNNPKNLPPGSYTLWEAREAVGGEWL